MAEKPDEQLLREKLTARLDENRALLQDALNGNLSADVEQRPLTSGGVRLCLVFLDGMAGRGDIDRFILEPCQRRVSPLPEGEALTMAYRAISDGARGVDMGRNIFQSEHPAAMCQAVSKIVHEKFTDKEAYQFYQELASK